MDDVRDLAQRIRSASTVVAFTGAGVSTLSGIPDFRGPDGLYRRPDADRIFDVDEFWADPTLFYTAARDFIYTMDTCAPSAVHLLLARMEEAALLAGVITQNIDMLHQRAGSRTVIELHGSTDELDSVADSWSDRVSEKPDAVCEGQQKVRLIHETLDRLPAKYGDVLEWKYVEGLPVSEIADRLGLDHSAAQSLLYRARMAFQAIYPDGIS